MAENKTAAVGEYYSVALFRTAGIEVRPAESAAEAEQTVNRLIKDGYKVIFLTENYAAAMEEKLKTLRKNTYPVILPIPGRNGADGYGINKIIANTEKALGTNIFKKD